MRGAVLAKVTSDDKTAPEPRVDRMELTDFGPLYRSPQEQRLDGPNECRISYLASQPSAEDDGTFTTGLWIGAGPCAENKISTETVETADTEGPAASQDNKSPD